jgi:shikimate kinase
MLRAILIGPPGAGKSTVGKALAKRLELSFSDTDHLIEERASKKIADIFVEDGETRFREIEEEIVAESLATAEGILALGGGAVMSARTQELLGSFRPKVILLEVSISQAAPRVGFNKERPLLAINPRQQWQALYEKRIPTYKRLAGFAISTDSKKPQEVAEEIARYLEGL